MIKFFYLLLNSENWIKRLYFLGIRIIKIVGYDLEFKNLVDKKFIR